MNPRNIPTTLKQYPNWVLWRAEMRLDANDEPYTTKVPHQANGRKAQSNNPATWCDFETAQRALATGDFTGIGFVFTQSPFVGIDLDAHRDADTGRISKFARRLIDVVDSYTEVSPSGTGLHIIARATLPDGRRKHPGYGLEMYQSRRFFTVTGGHLAGTPRDVCDRSEQIAYVHGKVFPQADEVDERSGPVDPTNLDDKRIIELATRAKNGSDFLRLWRGNWAGLYPSQSEADMALCMHLAFWTGCDEAQMDRMFRDSGLVRDKWDRVAKRDATGSLSYGDVTIKNACKHTGDVYTPASDDPEDIVANEVRQARQKSKHTRRQREHSRHKREQQIEQALELYSQ